MWNLWIPWTNRTKFSWIHEKWSKATEVLELVFLRTFCGHFSCFSKLKQKLRIVQKRLQKQFQLLVMRIRCDNLPQFSFVNCNIDKRYKRCVLNYHTGIMTIILIIFYYYCWYYSCSETVWSRIHTLYRNRLSKLLSSRCRLYIKDWQNFLNDVLLLSFSFA